MVTAVPPPPKPSPVVVHVKRIGDFEQPVAVAAPREDRSRLLVVERRGKVRLIRDGWLRSRPFADLSRRVVPMRGSEGKDQRGLFSIVFSPDYARSGRLYAFLVDQRSHLRVDELVRDPRNPDRIDPGRSRTVLDIGRVGFTHHGGHLEFGPDGLLWISTGQDDDPAASRDLGSLDGKLLRIDPREQADGRSYAVPSDNPFVGQRAARPEVMASGLRNPWRFSFDAPSGMLAIGDVGETAAEEVDALPVRDAAGADFGWNIREGRTRHARKDVARYVAPAIVHKHSKNWCAIVGGVTVRDPALPALSGRYLYGDVCSGRIWSARLAPSGAREDGRLALRIPYLVSFGTDASRHVYAVSFSGSVWRLVP